MRAAWAWVGMVALTISSEPSSELESRMLELINIEREARALPPLEVSQSLSKAAREYSRLMAEAGRVHHDLDGTVLDRIRNAEPDTCLFGENVSKHTTVDYSIGDLMLSEGHRANLLNERYTHIGIGIVEGEGEGRFLYITQEFAAPCERPQPDG